MEDICVVYSTKLGSTKTYADYIQEKTQGRLLEAKDFKGKDCPENVVIFCAPIYETGLLNLRILKKNMAYLEGKKVAVFCVGASVYEPEEFYRTYRRHLEGVLKDVPAFYGRGAWDQSRLKGLDKICIDLLYRRTKKKKKEDLAPWEEDFLTIYGKKETWVDFGYVDPLLDWISAKDPFDD